MPRSTLVVVERGLVDIAAPGARVSILGVLSLFERADKPQNPDAAVAAIRLPYLKVVGIDFNVDGHGNKSRHFSPAEEDRFVELSRRFDIYSLLAASIAPSIQGEYTLDIKKALACQLMGGCKKTLPDGVKLRGDINVLLLGDPSTAKSQFLKFVEKVAPVGVYTSGKGSSAAGLTASVIRDKNGEFFLEGGAMVLADGGICCIDEFDKMRETDRVAIHEAMEQQTISIAKAGITTVLNSRTSVLAAANPVYGRYDDLRSAAENIDMMSTILSRFDCIFIVRDIRDEGRDLSIAKHVMGVHMKASNTAGIVQASADPQMSSNNTADSILDLKLLRDYVAYCRLKCSPRLNSETAAFLQSSISHMQAIVTFYVGLAFIRVCFQSRSCKTARGQRRWTKTPSCTLQCAKSKAKIIFPPIVGACDCTSARGTCANRRVLGENATRSNRAVPRRARGTSIIQGVDHGCCIHCSTDGWS